MKTDTWVEVKPTGEPLPDWVLNKAETTADHFKLHSQEWKAQDDLRIFEQSYANYLSEN
jgi:hypothetical protein